MTKLLTPIFMDMNPNTIDLLKPSYGKKSYQIQCPKCFYGPMLINQVSVKCPKCHSTLLVEFKGGDYIIKVK